MALQALNVFRRRYLLFACALAAAPGVRAQPSPERVRRVAWLTTGSPTTHRDALEAFRSAMRERGWVEGKNLVLDLHWAHGDPSRLPALAAGIVRSRPDVIVTASNTVHLAVRRETSTIPIVMFTGSDPVAAGLAASLARPGGNVTGVTGFFDALPSKMLEIAAPFVPRQGRVAVMADSTFSTPGMRARIRQDLERAAGSAGVAIEFHDVATADDVARAFATLAERRPAALIVLPGAMLFALGARLVRSAEPLAIPVIYPFEEMVEAGGFISYAMDLLESYRRATRYVDLILKGASPGELAIEQPTSLRLAINLRTAKALGIAVPPSLLTRADRVVE